MGSGKPGQSERATETKKVKEYLRAHGINALVKHGRGTAWGWLEINIGAGQDFGAHDREADGVRCRPGCARCENLRVMSRYALALVCRSTNRHGDYDGKTLLLTQDHWNVRKNASEPIPQPDWTAERRARAEAYLSKRSHEAEAAAELERLKEETARLRRENETLRDGAPLEKRLEVDARTHGDFAGRARPPAPAAGGLRGEVERAAARAGVPPPAKPLQDTAGVAFELTAGTHGAASAVADVLCGVSNELADYADQAAGKAIAKLAEHLAEVFRAAGPCMALESLTAQQALQVVRAAIEGLPAPTWLRVRIAGRYATEAARAFGVANVTETETTNGEEGK